MVTGSLLAGPTRGVSVPRESPAPAAVADEWAELLADAEAMAGRYREEGWTAVVATTRDAAAGDDALFGLDVLVPEEEDGRIGERSGAGAGRRRAPI